MFSNNLGVQYCMRNFAKKKVTPTRKGVRWGYGLLGHGATWYAEVGGGGLMGH